MGKDITKYIQPVEEKIETVEYEGDVFTVRGKPDINILSRSVMQMPSVQENTAKHYSSLTGSEFKTETVAQVLFVKETLVDEREEAKGDPKARYDEVEIALIAANHAPLFLKLLEAAMKVLGLSDADKLKFGPDGANITDDPSLKAGLGNSLAAAD